MAAHVGDVIVVHGQTIRDNLGPNLDGEFKEGLAVVFHGDLEGDIPEGLPGREFLDKGLPMVLGYANLRVDAFGGHINSAKALAGIPLQKELIPNCFRVFKVHIAVEGNRPARKGLLRQTLYERIAIVLVVQNGFWRLRRHRTKVSYPPFLADMSLGCA